MVVQASDNGAAFTVQISNAAGTTTSAPFVLTAGIGPAITAQPQDVTVDAGQAPTLTVAATGTAPMTYQWFRNSSGLSGATSASYTGPISSATDTGTVFTVVISNSIGTVTSAPATLTVKPLSTPLAFSFISGKTYGDTPFPVSATSASPGAITYSVVSGPATVSGSEVTLNGVGTVVLSASQAATGNYAAAVASASFTVSPATPLAQLSIYPFEDIWRSQLCGSGQLSLPGGGDVHHHWRSGHPQWLSLSLSTAQVRSASPPRRQPPQTTLRQRQLPASTSQRQHPCSHSLRSLHIPMAIPPSAYVASSVSPGLIAYAVDSGPATISGSTLTITGVGVVTLSASQVASGNYSSAAATTSFAATAASPTLAFATIPSKSYGDAPFNVSATSASTGAVTYNVVSGPASVSGSTVTIAGTGSVVLAASQAARRQLYLGHNHGQLQRRPCNTTSHLHTGRTQNLR